MFFRGNLEDVGVLTLIQFAHQSRSSGKLVLKDAAGDAYLFYRDGDVVHAARNGEEGMDALVDIIDLAGGEFEFQNGVPSEKVTIAMDIPRALMNALRLRDERKLNEAVRLRQEAEERERAAAAEEEARLKAEAEARQKAEEAARLQAEAEARQKAEEAAKLQAEAEARQKAEEAAKLQAEAEARQKAEAEAKQKAEEEARLHVEAEARQNAEAEATAKVADDPKLLAEKAALAARLNELLAAAPIFSCAYISNGGGAFIARAERTTGELQRRERLRDSLLGLAAAYPPKALKRVFLEDEMGTGVLVALPGNRNLVAVADTTTPLGSISVGIGKFVARLAPAPESE